MSADEAREDLSQVEFRYIFPDDYNPVYSNGVHGGVGSQGEIVMSFYQERPGLPRKEQRSLQQDGRVGELLNREPSQEHPKVVRYVSCGVIMNLAAAERLHTWLESKIEQAKNLTQSEPENNEKQENAEG